MTAGWRYFRVVPVEYDGRCSPEQAEADVIAAVARGAAVDVHLASPWAAHLPGAAVDQAGTICRSCPEPWPHDDCACGIYFLPTAERLACYLEMVGVAATAVARITAAPPLRRDPEPGPAGLGCLRADRATIVRLWLAGQLEPVAAQIAERHAVTVTKASASLRTTVQTLAGPLSGRFLTLDPRHLQESAA